MRRDAHLEPSAESSHGGTSPGMPTQNATLVTPSELAPTVAGADFPARFRANPGLAMGQLMSVNRAATFDAAAVSARNHANLDRENTTRTVRPVALSGDIALRRNTTMARRTHTGPDVTTSLTGRDRAALAVADELIHDLLAAGFPTTLEQQAASIADILGRVAQRWAGNGLDRRGPMFAEAAARYLLTWCRPNALAFAHTNHLRKWHVEACETHDATTTHDADGNQPSRAGLDVSFIRRPRVVWTHPAGPGNGLLLDRLHTANRPGGVVRDQGVHAKVAADLTDVATFLLPATLLTADPAAAQRAILGVRVLTHRAPNAGVHFLPAFTSTGAPVIGSHHPLGACAVCASTPHLPLTMCSTNTSVSVGGLR